MTDTNRERALGRGIPASTLSGEIRKLVIKGTPLLSKKDRMELDAWLVDFKRQRFGKRGYESWLAEHTAD